MQGKKRFCLFSWKSKRKNIKYAVRISLMISAKNGAMSDGRSGIRYLVSVGYKEKNRR